MKEYFECSYSQISQIISKLALNGLVVKEKKGQKTKLVLTNTGKEEVRQHVQCKLNEIQEYFHLIRRILDSRVINLEKYWIGLNNFFNILREYFLNEM